MFNKGAVKMKYYKAICTRGHKGARCSKSDKSIDLMKCGRDCSHREEEILSYKIEPIDVDNYNQ